MGRILCFLGLHKWTWTLTGKFNKEGWTKYIGIPDHAWCKRCYVRKKDAIVS